MTTNRIAIHPEYKRVHPRKGISLKPDFDTMFEEYGNVPDQELSDRYGVQIQTIKRWALCYGLNDTIGLENIPTREQLLADLENLTFNQVRRKHSISVHTLRKWCYIRQIEINTPYRRKIPSGIPEDRREYYLKQYYLGLMDEDDLQQEMNVPPSTIALWLRSEYDVMIEPIDPDFVDNTKRMTVRELSDYYAVKLNVIVGWGKLSKIKFEKGF